MRVMMCASALAAATGLVPVATAQYFVQGSWNGYAFDTPMTQIDAVKWSRTLSLTPGSRHNGLAATAGYTSQAPPAFGDARFEVPASGAITINLFDQTSWSDGWFPDSQRRFGYEGTTNGWQLVGSWNGFATPGPVMASLGNGVYELAMNLAPGNYEYKFRYNDDWDINIGADTLGNNRANLMVTSPVNGNTNITFQLDLPNGRVRAIPTPGALALLGLGGLVVARRRR